VQLVTTASLTEFDPFYSTVTWFRDYAAYCGINENTDKLYAIVMQLGRKKPVVRKEIGAASNGDDPGDNGIEVDISTQCQQILIDLDGDAVITVLKYVAHFLIAKIKVPRIKRIEIVHRIA